MPRLRAPTFSALIVLLGLALPVQAAPAPLVFDFEDGLQGWELHDSAQRVQTQVLGGEWAIFGDGLAGRGAAISLDMDLTNIRYISVEQHFAGDASLRSLGTAFLWFSAFKPGGSLIFATLRPESDANPGTIVLGKIILSGVYTVRFRWRVFGEFPSPPPPDHFLGFIDNITFHPVPEPGTWALLAFGLSATMIGCRWGR